MVVNHSKTEILAVGNTNVTEIGFGGSTIQVVARMKALGVIFDKNLTWECQVGQVLAKSRGLLSTMRFLRKKLAPFEFLKAMTPTHFGVCYYATQIWLPMCKRKELKKLTSLHYQFLRIVVNDWSNALKREDLDEIGRAEPLI